MDPRHQLNFIILTKEKFLIYCFNKFNQITIINFIQGFDYFIDYLHLVLMIFTKQDALRCPINQKCLAKILNKGNLK